MLFGKTKRVVEAPTTDAKRQVVEQMLDRCQEGFLYSMKYDCVAAAGWQARMETCQEILDAFNTVDRLGL